MNPSSNTILVTGGASGIGLALAARFLQAGNRVIVCGRREKMLAEVRAKHPEIETRVCDLSTPAAREALAAWATTTFPALNVLVNNAGIQRSVRLAEDRNWTEMREEIAVNLEGPLHLTSLLLPHLMTQRRAAILNITSALAFVPLASVPIYCATKAAMRSYTLSLRQQLAKTPVEVIEIIPPAVNTDLGGPGLHTFGVPLDEFADAAMTQLSAGATEVTFGLSREASQASREGLNAMFQRMNARG